MELNNEHVVYRCLVRDLTVNFPCSSRDQILKDFKKVEKGKFSPLYTLPSLLLPGSQSSSASTKISEWRLSAANATSHTIAFGKRMIIVLLKMWKPTKLFQFLMMNSNGPSLLFLNSSKLQLNVSFEKYVDIDRGRLKVSKFQAKSGWILSCDHWPYSGGHSIIRVCYGENRQGWLSFCKMLESL